MTYQPHLGDILNVNFSPFRGYGQQDYRPAVVVSHHIMAQTSPFIYPSVRTTHEFICEMN